MERTAPATPTKKGIVRTLDTLIERVRVDYRPTIFWRYGCATRRTVVRQPRRRRAYGDVTTIALQTRPPARR